MAHQKKLIVCCPHYHFVPEEGSNLLIVEGGPITLAPPVHLFRGSLLRLIKAQAEAQHVVGQWASRSGPGQISLLAHASCKCVFLDLDDATEMDEELQRLAEQLHVELIGHPMVEIFNLTADA